MYASDRVHALLDRSRRSYEQLRTALVLLRDPATPFGSSNRLGLPISRQAASELTARPGRTTRSRRPRRCRARRAPSPTRCTPSRDGRSKSRASACVRRRSLGCVALDRPVWLSDGPLDSPIRCPSSRGSTDAVQGKKDRRLAKSAKGALFERFAASCPCRSEGELGLAVGCC